MKHGTRKDTSSHARISVVSVVYILTRRNSNSNQPAQGFFCSSGLLYQAVRGEKGEMNHGEFGISTLS